MQILGFGSGADKYSWIYDFFCRTEEHGHLLAFFRSLSSYAEWYEHRRSTFQHFKVLSIKLLSIGTRFSCHSHGAIE